MTTDRDLLHLAKQTLTEQELNVWIAKHIRGLGRRTGSRTLAITEEQYRHRLDQANRKIDAALQENAA